MSYKSTNTEYSRLSNVIEKITNDVTRALEKNLGEIIENEKNVNNCLMNIPQIKQIADENIELKKTNETLRSINKSIQDTNIKQGHTIAALQRKIKDLIENGAMKINTGEQSNNNDKKIIEMQKKCLIKLRKDNQELKDKLNGVTSENNISLEVEEYETKKNDNNDQSEFYDKVKESGQENEILVNKIQVDNDNDNDNELFQEEESETESSSDDQDDDILMLEHWEKERKKLDNMNQYGGISLEAPDNDEDEEEEEEEEEVEEYELMINGKEYRVYRSNTGNIYEILEDDEAGELMGTINDKGEFIEL
tara:strand:- start:2097 stop:3020 length:924 start_codon:yes stop_codon:yes gene_type:complete